MKSKKLLLVVDLSELFIELIKDKQIPDDIYFREAVLGDMRSLIRQRVNLESYTRWVHAAIRAQYRAKTGLELPQPGRKKETPSEGDSK